MRHGWGLSIAALLLVAGPLSGQERSRVVVPSGDDAVLRVRASSAGRSAELSMVERVLRQRERLELSDQQASQLEEMRRQALERWIANTLEQEELQSRRRAGYEDADASERLRALAEARREDAEQMRERVDALLTEPQREQLNRRTRALVAPRGVLQRVPEARARIRAPGATPAPEARRAPVPSRAPRVMPAPRSPRAVPAPRPPRARRWL